MNYKKIRLTHLLDHITKDFDLISECESLAKNADSKEKKKLNQKIKERKKAIKSWLSEIEYLTEDY